MIFWHHLWTNPEWVFKTVEVSSKYPSKTSSWNMIYIASKTSSIQKQSHQFMIKVQLNFIHKHLLIQYTRNSNIILKKDHFYKNCFSLFCKASKTSFAIRFCLNNFWDYLRFRNHLLSTFLHLIYWGKIQFRSPFSAWKKNLQQINFHGKVIFSSLFQFSPNSVWTKKRTFICSKTTENN